MEPTFRIEEYITANGKSPFGDWFLSLKDRRAQAKLQLRFDRVTLGNFGDYKTINGEAGLYELREHYAQGYRVYYTIMDRAVVLLLAGSTKRDQKRVIVKATEYLADYHGRRQHHEPSDTSS